MSFVLRVHVMGSFVDIKSPVNATEFLQGMCSLINQRSADTTWTGYHQFDSTEGSVVWIRVRSIDIVEDITNKITEEVAKKTPPKKRKSPPKKRVSKKDIAIEDDDDKEIELYK